MEGFGASGPTNYSMDLPCDGEEWNEQWYLTWEVSWCSHALLVACAPLLHCSFWRRQRRRRHTTIGIMGHLIPSSKSCEVQSPKLEQIIERRDFAVW